MSPSDSAKVMRVEIHSMAGTPTVLENVSALKVPLAEFGSLGILPGHAPLVAATEEGDLLYTVNDEMKKMHVSGGILSITDNVVSILTTK